MKKVLLMVFLSTLILASACKMDTEGLAQLQLLNNSNYRIHCLLDDGLALTEYGLDAGQMHSLLLDLGEYRVKLELYRGSEPVAGRLYNLSLTTIGQIHQITVDDSWVSGVGQ